jgi:hypothetical protein
MSCEPLMPSRAMADQLRRRQQRARALAAHGLRQIEIAASMGVSKSTVSKDSAKSAADGNGTLML